MIPDRIVMVAFGPVYHAQAALCVQGLRRVFPGPIDVVSDGAVPGATVHRASEADFVHPSAAKLLLPASIDMDDREAVLYLDCDFLALGPLDLPPLGHRVMVYGYPRRTQAEPSFAAPLTEDPAILGQQAFCAGLLYYRPSAEVREAFAAAYAGYSAARRTKRLPCWEQHSINLELCRRGLADYSLTGLVAEDRRRPAPPGALLVHFCGMGPQTSLDRMRKQW